MSILKNEPIYPIQDGDYSKPRHIVVEGTNEEIGFDLATLAKSEYDAKLGLYSDAAYGQARREYLKRNWPAMLERSQGVLRAYGLSPDDVVYDATALPYDFYDTEQGGKLDFNTCSAAVLPHEKTDSGATYVSRNFDLMAMVLWSDLKGKQPPEGAYRCWERGVVLETRPDTGYKTILIGGQELLKEKFATLQSPYKRDDATALTDAVHCAFVDDHQAEAAPKERTLINTNADLSKPEISVRFYLGDVNPVAGTNHMEDRMSEFYTFGF